MSKHTLDFKLAVIKHYEQGFDGQKSTAKRFGIENGAVRRWVLAYQYHGISGLTSRPGSYTAEFKESVVLYRQQHHLSIREVAARFNIPSHPSITIWEKLYTEGGIEALSNKRGYPTEMSDSTKPMKDHNLRPISEMSPKELHAELQQLRMENAYLKKLQALVQPKRPSAGTPKQRSSKN